MSVPESNLDGQNLESEYVSKVYEEIADHFDETRHSNWGVVNKFLDYIPIDSVVLDAGCGNGKYLIRKDALFKIGGDLCENLVRIAHDKDCHVFRGDALALPIRSSSIDAALSIAVIHHFSTLERRLRALLELERVLRRGGRACVTVWAMEQQQESMETESVYSKTRKLKDVISENVEEYNELLNTDESFVDATRKLRVHDGRNTFTQQDMLIPWNSKRSSENELNQKQFLRYYHLFVKGELAKLVEQLTECTLISVEFEEGNWAAIFEKI